MEQGRYVQNKKYFKREAFYSRSCYYYLLEDHVEDIGSLLHNNHTDGHCVGAVECVMVLARSWKNVRKVRGTSSEGKG